MPGSIPHRPGLAEIQLNVGGKCFIGNATKIKL
jgi:hypothetical protein